MEGPINFMDQRCLGVNRYGGGAVKFVDQRSRKIFWFALPVLMFLLAGVWFIENLDRFSQTAK